MGFVIAFVLGVGFAVLILSLLRAAGSSDRLLEAYWEGYRHGADDAEAGQVMPPGASAPKAEAKR